MELSADELTAGLVDCPFAQLLGMRLAATSDDPDGLVLAMPMDARFERISGTGQLHGGPIAALIDTAATFAAVGATALAASTVDLRVDYLRPAVASELTATALVRRRGRTVLAVDVDVVDDRQRLVAIGRGTFLVPATGGRVQANGRP